MKPIMNTAKISRRARLSNLASIGGLVLLLASVLLPVFLQNMAQYSLFMMIVGLGVAMVGIYFANRWVRKPRPEEMLDKALKSMPDSYHLYHYPALPSDHLLLTPNGVIILETVGLAGKFSYLGRKWRESMSMGRALRSIVEERLGDPIKSAMQTEQRLREKFSLEGMANVPVKSMVVFTHPAAVLDLENPSIPVVKAEKLKKQVTINAPRLAEEVYDRLEEFFQKITLS